MTGEELLGGPGLPHTVQAAGADHRDQVGRIRLADAVDLEEGGDGFSHLVGAIHLVVHEFTELAREETHQQRPALIRRDHRSLPIRPSTSLRYSCTSLNRLYTEAKRTKATLSSLFSCSITRRPMIVAGTSPS